MDFLHIYYAEFRMPFDWLAENNQKLRMHIAQCRQLFHLIILTWHPHSNRYFPQIDVTTYSTILTGNTTSARLVVISSSILPPYIRSPVSA
jgi:hypothetical protein